MHPWSRTRRAYAWLTSIGTSVCIVVGSVCIGSLGFASPSCYPRGGGDDGGCGGGGGGGVGGAAGGRSPEPEHHDSTLTIEIYVFFFFCILAVYEANKTVQYQMPQLSRVAAFLGTVHIVLVLWGW